MATIYLKHELGNYYLVAEIEFLIEEEYPDVDYYVKYDHDYDDRLNRVTSYPTSITINCDEVATFIKLKFGL